MLIIFLISQLIFLVRSTDDLIELNIGGQRMTTLRSTLTAIPHSKLARMFARNETHPHLLKDESGAIFFDYNPIYFSALLDQLRTIKRMSRKSSFEYQFAAPFYSQQWNFTHMLIDFGLTPERLLSPMEGTHQNLSIQSLVGWQECYRTQYDKPFDMSVLSKSCNGTRLLVACRPTENKKLLTLAAVGERDDLLYSCLPKPCGRNRKLKNKTSRASSNCLTNYQCITQAKRGVGWYHVPNQTWGFVRGSLAFIVNPCDSSNLDSEYRLCWTMKHDRHMSHGDRCGSVKNLHQSNQWERLIYSTD